jgi:Fe-S-cluster formation regulator IscX/YfhJ
MKTRFIQRQRELSAELKTLRVLVKEVGGNYLAGLQADIARVDRALADVDPNQRRMAELRRMLVSIEQLDLKPHKGRRRDLKALDKLIGQLTEIVEEW